jgi:pyroglutamyl-peptidase
MASEPTVLVTGFEPFDPPWPNPSGLAASALDGRAIAGARVCGAVLPVAYGAAGARLGDAIARERPSIVIALGMGGSESFRLERKAVDRDDAPDRPDNLGVERRGGHRDHPEEPEERFATLPLAAIARAMTARGAAPYMSESAGRFVCNDLFYDLLRAAERAGIASAGFIHVPHPRTFAAQGLKQARLEDAVAAAVEAAVLHARGAALRRR